MKKLMSLLLVLSTLLCLLVACGDDKDPTTTTTTGAPISSTTTNPAPTTTTPAPATHRVVLMVDTNITVTGTQILTVADGENAVFTLTPNDGYLISNVSAGTYDEVTGTLTIENVTEDMTVNVKSASTAATLVTVSLSGSRYSVLGGATSQTVEEGQAATFTLRPEHGYGIASVSAGSFDPETGILTVTAGDADVTVTVSASKLQIRYHLNNGTSETFVQYLNSTFYTAPNSLVDDGTLVRRGYALLEYNTKADGTGKAYSIGTKITMNYSNEAELYCIWEKETPTSDFTFSSSTLTFNGVKGYAVTAYNGNAETVVIPTTYNNRPVIQINTGAFQNKTNMKTLVMSKSLLNVQSGAVVGCSALDTLYFSDSIYSIPDDAFDAATYSNFHHFYLNTTRAPRYCKWFEGAFRVKWDRLVKSDKPRIVILSGSSSLFGISSQYFEQLMDGEYTVVNFGTIRTTCMMLYMEAFASELGEGDILIWAPEYSAYQMGGTKLNDHKIFRDTEGMRNVFRQVDIANYSNYFSGFSDYQAKNYTSAESSFDIGAHTGGYPVANSTINEYGDLISNKTATSSTTPGLMVSLDGKIHDEANKDAAATTMAATAATVNKIAAKLQANGTTVYFGFSPVSDKALTTAAKTASRQQSYMELVAELYDFDAIGSVSGHIFSYNLFFGGDTHHLTNKGAVKHTYQMYVDVCTALGKEVKYDANAFKNDGIPGCEW